MEDRVSLYPGRVTLTPVSGQTNTYDMVRADEPTQEGTPLNKANLLKDTTAALYGLDENAVPDEVLAKLPKQFDAKVGDTLVTLRTDLGDKWLLCNGGAASKEEYPELVEMSLGIVAQQLGTVTQTQLKNVACGNGRWVAVGHINSDPYIFTTTDPTSAWTSQTIDTSVAILYDVAYYDGMWVAVGYYGNKSVIFTTTDPTGTWTKSVISTAAIMYKIICYDGTWVAVGYETTNSYPYYFTTTDPTGVWAGYKITSTATTVTSIDCYDGTWVAVLSTKSDAYPYIYTTTDLTGTWEGRQLSATSSPQWDIACYNGTWVTVGRLNSNNCPYIYTTTDPTGTWTGYQISDVSNALQSVACCSDGTWVAVGIGGTFPYIFTTTDPTGAWTRQELSSQAVSLYGIACHNEEWVAVGNLGTGTTQYSYMFSNAGANLPTISVDGAYTYIKAKE